MKFIKLAILLHVVCILMHSCSTSKNVANNQTKNEDYIRYLSSVINDTVFYEFSELTIIDDGIYPVLDSVILWSEKCKYFDNRIKYLHTFRFAALPKDNEFRYSIHAHMSPSSAIGLLLVKAGFITELEMNVGIFYYRNYLFVVPTEGYRGQKDLEYFSFFKPSGNKIKIRAPEFLDEKEYASYITFDKVGSNFKILENEVCGLENLIQ